MEHRSVKRLGATRPKKGVKVVDLSAKRMVPKKPEKKAWGDVPNDM